MREAVLVDLDGTKFNVEHRSHFVKDADGNFIPSGEVDWEAYALACVDDKPIEAVVRLVQMLSAAGYLIFYVTGRSGIAREETERQLQKLNSTYTELIMRQPGVLTTNAEFKVQTIRRMEEKHDCKFVLAIDDYHKAAAGMEAAGVPTILVHENGGSARR